MNYEQARFNMVEQQIRPWKVVSPTVRELLLAVRREDFVPAAYRSLALADTEIPLGYGVAMWSPALEARALDALGVRKRERILEIGTGSGYMAALLAMHAEHVLTVEIVPELAQRARDNLGHAGIGNVSVETGDGLAGQPAAGPFDAIVVSGGLVSVPAALSAQLRVGACLFAIVGQAPAMTARLITRVAEDAFRSEDLFETQVPLLRGALANGGFAF